MLPESYLKRWIDPATLSKKPSVWIVSKDGKDAKLRSPANAHFWREYFYDLISVTGERNQVIEDTLGKIEGWTSTVTVEKLDQKIAVDRSEAEALDLFVGCMRARTERFKQSVQSFAQAMARNEGDYAAAYGLPLPSRDVSVRNTYAFSVMCILECVPKEISNWTHEVFIAPAGNFFVTSDNPCVWDAFMGPPGLENCLLEITLPLSPKHLLYISKKPRLSAYREIPDDLVDYLNWRTIRHCAEYFVSNQASLKPSWFEREVYWLKETLKQFGAPVSDPARSDSEQRASSESGAPGK